jgi:hypothetical protein
MVDRKRVFLVTFRVPGSNPETHFGSSRRHAGVEGTIVVRTVVDETLSGAIRRARAYCMHSVNPWSVVNVKEVVDSEREKIDGVMQIS